MVIDEVEDLDKVLLSIKKYCHPDAPKEFIVLSKEPINIKAEDLQNELVKELFNPLREDEKTAIKLILNDREVEIIRDPLLEGKLEVVVKREPKGTFLTYKEVYEILKKCEEALGLKISWKRPFPRGSC